MRWKKKEKNKEEIFEQENILEKEFLIYIIKNPELFEEIKMRLMKIILLQKNIGIFL